MAVLLLAGVRGGCTGNAPNPCGDDPSPAPPRAAARPLGADRSGPVLLRSDVGAAAGRGGAASSSGSTSSNRRSAALSACSARARIASSTIGCWTPAGGELVPVESAFDSGGRELLERGENDAADLAARSGGGGYLSYGEEKEMRWADVSRSMSESLSSGIGMLDASSSESSSAACMPAMLIDSRYGYDDAAGGGGRPCSAALCRRTEPRGGDAGSAVCAARRSDPRLLPFGDPARGDDSRRRYSGVGDGGLSGTTAVRAWSLVGTNPEAVDRGSVPPETTRARGGGGDDEGTLLIGECARGGPDGPLLLPREGDADRFAGGDVVRAAEVA